MTQPTQNIIRFCCLYVIDLSVDDGVLPYILVPTPDIASGTRAHAEQNSSFFSSDIFFLFLYIKIKKKMTSLFNPRCRVPTFQQTEGEIVKMCGRRTGYIISSIITVVVLIISGLRINSLSKVKKTDKNKKPKSNTGKIVSTVFITLLVLTIIWLGIPNVIAFFQHNSWRGYQEQLQQLQKQGYSRRESLTQIQSLHQSDTQANATKTAGLNVASALLASSRR